LTNNFGAVSKAWRILGLQIWRSAANILKKKSQRADKGSVPSLGVLLTVKKQLVSQGLGIGQIYLAQDRYQWRALVTTVMKLRVL
jgi:hypothetical protein